MVKESQAHKQDAPATLADKMFGGLIVLVAFLLYLFMQLHDFEISKWNSEMSALENKSSLHALIVPNYRDCMISRNPNHIVCVGALSQAAQVKGYEIKDIRSAFADIEALNMKYGAKGF